MNLLMVPAATVSSLGTRRKSTNAMPAKANAAKVTGAYLKLSAKKAKIGKQAAEHGVIDNISFGYIIYDGVLATFRY